MFYDYDESLISIIRQGNPLVVDFVDNSITAHRLGTIILALPRRILLELSGLQGLSASSQKTLSYISNRANDYIAAARISDRIVHVCTDEITHNVIIRGRDVFVNYRILNLKHLVTQKFLLAEGFRDVGLAIMLSFILLRDARYPEGLISLRRIAGGGGQTCQFLDAEDISPLKGIMLCDADTHQSVPPFPAHTTGHTALERAAQLGLVGQNLGISDRSPFFGFLATGGRSIENMVGPYALEAFFEGEPTSRAQRVGFVAAFPDFPKLDVQEHFVWRSLNLKNGTQTMNAIFDSFRATFGSVPPRIVSKASAFTKLSLPINVLDWLLKNWAGGRWARSLTTAILNDLEEPVYRQTVEYWAQVLRTLAAGDAAGVSS